jgi:hypothetical protein
MIRETMMENKKTVAATAPAFSDTSPFESTPLEELIHTASNTALTEDLALSLLNRPDLPAEAIEQLAKNGSVLKLRKVKVAIVCHPHAPRHVSVPLARQFYTFDLMKVALSPTAPADVKVAADEVLIARVKTITLGERLTLARRASGRVAGALLLDPEARVVQTALENPRLTESFVVQAVLRPGAGISVVQAVSHHPKWSYRNEIRVALLRSEHLSLARALEFARGLTPPLLRDVLHTSRLPARIKEQVLREIERGAAS